jgi:hypothetical protein
VGVVGEGQGGNVHRLANSGSCVWRCEVHVQSRHRCQRLHTQAEFTDDNKMNDQKHYNTLLQYRTATLAVYSPIAQPVSCQRAH